MFTEFGQHSTSIRGEGLRKHACVLWTVGCRVPSSGTAGGRRGACWGAEASCSVPGEGEKQQVLIVRSEAAGRHFSGFGC